MTALRKRKNAKARDSTLRLSAWAARAPQGAVFMELAGWDGTIESALRFVSEYGCLTKIPGLNRPARFCTLNPAKGDDLDEDGAIFSQTAAYLAGAVDLWTEAKKTGDFRRLIKEFNHFDPPFPDMPDAAPIQLRLIDSLEPGEPPLLAVVPEDLVAALWFQFAEAVAGRVKIQHCRVCPRWFTYGPGTSHRKSAQYCSDRCRKAAHRQRTEKDNG